MLMHKHYISKLGEKKCLEHLQVRFIEIAVPKKTSTKITKGQRFTDQDYINLQKNLNV